MVAHEYVEDVGGVERQLYRSHVEDALDARCLSQRAQLGVVLQHGCVVAVLKAFFAEDGQHDVLQEGVAPLIGLLEILFQFVHDVCAGASDEDVLQHTVAQIQLVQKAYTKLQSFHTLFGEDNQVFTEAEEVVHYDLNMQVNGEESPMERYISELKSYKEAHPDRFALIAAKEDGLDVAAPTADGHSYFLVRNKRVHSLFVEVDKDCNAHIIPAIDMYRRFRTDPAEQPCPLPDDWQRRKHAAELVVNQYLTRLNRQGRNSPKATDAKALLTRMNEQLPLSAASRSIVEAAFQMVNKGNIDIINKVLALGAEMENQQLSLFAMTQEEIDDVLEREIKRIVSNVERRFGKAEAYIGLSK